MLAIRLSKELEARIDRLAKRTGRTKTFYARQAIEEHSGDLEDAYLAYQSRREVARGGALLSQGEVEQRLRTRPKPTINQTAIRGFCQKHQVARFYLFGSILRDDFSESSDVDVLLDLGERCLGYDEHFAMVGELRALFERAVDLVEERQLLSGHTHPSIVANIMKSRKMIYEAVQTETKSKNKEQHEAHERRSRRCVSRRNQGDVQKTPKVAQGSELPQVC